MERKKNTSIKSMTVASMERLAEIFQASKAGVPVLLEVGEVAAITGLSIPKLNQHRASGQGPEFIKLGSKLVKYRLDRVIAWLDSAPTRSSGTTAIPILLDTEV